MQAKRRAIHNKPHHKSANNQGGEVLFIGGNGCEASAKCEDCPLPDCLWDESEERLNWKKVPAEFKKL